MYWLVIVSALRIKDDKESRFFFVLPVFLIGLFNNILSDARREASETKKPLATKWIKGSYATINHVFDNKLVS